MKIIERESSEIAQIDQLSLSIKNQKDQLKASLLPENEKNKDNECV